LVLQVCTTADNQELNVYRSLVLAVTLGAVPARVFSQNQTTQSPAVGAASASTYDFLIGDWELMVTPKVSSLAARIHGVPKLRGTWKASRNPDGSIEDELRIFDDGGNPRAITRTVRRFSAAEKRWLLTSRDMIGKKDVQSIAGSSAGGKGIVAIHQAVDGSGAPYVARVRIENIGADHFTWFQDRSSDGGRSWASPQLTIEARRVPGTHGSGDR
jgi:hypothetical protein